MKKKDALVIVCLMASQVLLANVSFSRTKEKLAATKTEIQYLSGTGKDNTVDWDFFCSDGMNSKKWTKIGVPSCWELQGFGAYNYGLDPMDKRAHEFGLYKHSFFVPKAWKKKDVKIVFEGVMTDAEVKINGKSAGAVHQGAFYEFNYSISKLLKYGQQNQLEVKVNKVSANQSINYAERQADFWVFGGIYRPVYLQILPKEHIDRVAIDAEASGKINADLYLDAPSANDVQVRLQALSGKTLQKLNPVEINKTDGKWSISTKADHIKTWNPGQPNLYQLAFDLLDKNGHVLHTLVQRIGFRTVQVLTSDGIYVNGQRIKFKGVNRHSFYPNSGRTTSKALSIEQVKMMKDMNMNAVRMSHYPPDVHFLDVCDSLGLFVLDEVCTWHTPVLDTQVGHKIVKETVVRDINHPSILFWDNGNETGWNTALDNDFPKWDIQKREVLHPWNIFRKTNTLHYVRYQGLADDGYKKDKIFFPTEFLHGLYDGGLGAGLEDYWNLMWNMPLCAGGFLWVFADEGVVRTDKNGILDTDGNHAPDGIVGPYGEKEASYYTIKEVWSPIHLEDRFIRNDFNGIFRVENRYLFTNLNECKMTASWIKFNGPHGSSAGDTIAKSDIQLPDLAPCTKGTFKVDLPDNWKTADVLDIKATDPNGKEIFTWSYPVKQPKVLNSELLSSDESNAVKVENRGQQIIVHANQASYAFDAKSGLLDQVKKGHTLIPLSNGPVILGEHDKTDTIIVESTGNKATITVRYAKTSNQQEWVTHQKKSSDLIQWTVLSNGLLNLEVKMKSKKVVTDFKGITFSFPEKAVEGMKWLGDGPYRVWRNRMKGTRFQVWENTYNNTVTGESEWIYPEFKGYYSNLYWANIKGKVDNGFIVYCHSPFTFLRMLTPKNPSGDPNGRLSPKFPTGDISFLKNIPPIGTKFQDPETMGPHGSSENYFGNDDNPIVMKLTFEF